MSFIDLAKARYSVRGFKDQQVEDEKIAQILEAAKVAPTAKNIQAQRVYVLKSQEALQAANKVSECMYDAPLAFLIGYDSTEDWHSPFLGDVHSGEVDAAIVATHMMLEAADLGLGTCPVAYFRPQLAHELFHLPEGVVPVLLLPCGYPADEAKPAARHELFRPDDEWIKEL